MYHGRGMSPFRRASGRGGAARGVGACALAFLYLALGYSALTCALHHGLYGACAHMGAAPGAMVGMHDMAAMPAGHDGPGDSAPSNPSERAAIGLCHCLDNLAAEPPAPLLAALPAPVPPGLVAVPAALPAAPPVGLSRPRAPPANATA